MATGYSLSRVQEIFQEGGAKLGRRVQYETQHDNRYEI